MKKIYLITRKDGRDYDEYDSIVVIAENEKEAFKVSEAEIKDEDYWVVENVTFRMVGESLLDSQVILSSYNAG